MDNKWDLLLQSISSSQKFELFVGLLTLSSVILALVFYIPGFELSSTQINAIYIFDLFVCVVLAFDFCVRVKVSKNGIRYVIRHCYEIPAMIPLIVFALFEDPLFLGAAVRSIRFIRLLRLVRLFRLANLFRAAEHWKLSTFLYLVIILAASVIFGAIAIIIVEEENNKNIQDFEDALWFAVTTITISGFGDVVPVTTSGRIIATVLSFIGLAIILGFLANVGSGLISSRLNKKQKILNEEAKASVIRKINSLEQLHEEEFTELISVINGLHEQSRTIKNSVCVCSNCNNNYPVESIYCNKCGQKV
jgi:voltage-gated potassium channel